MRETQLNLPRVRRVGARETASVRLRSGRRRFRGVHVRHAVPRVVHRCRRMQRRPCHHGRGDERHGRDGRAAHISATRRGRGTARHRMLARCVALLGRLRRRGRRCRAVHMMRAVCRRVRRGCRCFSAGRRCCSVRPMRACAHRNGQHEMERAGRNECANDAQNEAVHRTDLDTR